VELAAKVIVIRLSVVFIEEAIICINQMRLRGAAIFLGGAPAIHRMRKNIESVGFPAFNAASGQLKVRRVANNKRWNKNFAITSFGELQKQLCLTPI